MNRGNTRYRMGDSRGAIDDYDKAEAADPKNVPAIFSRGIVRMDLKEYKEARADLQKSLELDPRNPYAEQAKQQLARIPSGAGTL